MQGLYGKTHFELDEFINLKSFDNIRLEICRGIGTAVSIANHGYLVPHSVFDKKDLSYNTPFVTLTESYQKYIALPDTDPIKIIGNEIEKTHGYNSLSAFLKYSYKAHDLGSHFLFWDYTKGWRESGHREFTSVAAHFPKLIQWIDTLISNGVFSTIGRAYLMTVDSNGCSHEHCDPVLDPDIDDHTPPEFIHIRPNLNRPFYVYDSTIKQKHYINARVGWWNDKDLHGGDPHIEPSYAVRIDGVFTNEFRKKIKIT